MCSWSGRPTQDWELAWPPVDVWCTTRVRQYEQEELKDGKSSIWITISNALKLQLNYCLSLCWWWQYLQQKVSDKCLCLTCAGYSTTHKYDTGTPDLFHFTEHGGTTVYVINSMSRILHLPIEVQWPSYPHCYDEPSFSSWHICPRTFRLVWGQNMTYCHLPNTQRCWLAMAMPQSFIQANWFRYCPEAKWEGTFVTVF